MARLKTRGTGKGRTRERGITLMLAIFVLLALTFAALGLMYFVRYDSEMASNAAVHTEAMQATDVGLEAANVVLQAHAGFPEASNMGGVSWWYPPTGLGPPPPPSVGFWSGCAGAGTCGVVPGGVVIGGTTFDVEYVIAPSGAPAAILNGAGPSSRNVTSYMTYTAYVNARLSNGSLAVGSYHNMNANIQATIRKVD